MGEFLRDSTTGDVFHQVWRRFNDEAHLQEMAQSHKELGIFSEEHSLRQAFQAVHIVPEDHQERQRWYKYLDALKKFHSDHDGVSGHDRIHTALRENLESRTPRPVYWKTHLATEDKRVTITHGPIIPHEKRHYMVISVPTKPRKDSGGAPAGAPRAPARKVRAKQ